MVEKKLKWLLAIFAVLFVAAGSPLKLPSPFRRGENSLDFIRALRPVTPNAQVVD